MNNISRDLDNMKILLHKLFVRYLVVKPAFINAALEKTLLPLLTLAKQSTHYDAQPDQPANLLIISQKSNLCIDGE